MSELGRPDPDALLARVQAEDAAARRGKLKIFIGAAAGVGKTYAMLEEARLRKADGVDVVIGYIEPHGRADTERLMEGFEAVPTRSVEYRGAKLREFDLDAALSRKPQLILLDELAHTNAEGSRHPKRWRDALELLDAGIDVYTTVNIQHVESLNDLVAQITGVVVRETVPDSVIEQADLIELIDLTPEELIERLKDGKVYHPQQVDQALRGFFRRGNLTALRELALRKTAERVDAQMQAYQREKAISDVWPTAERLLVCLPAHATAVQLVRAAKRLANGLRAEWIVCFVEAAGPAAMSEAQRVDLTRAVKLAEDLGARSVTLSGHDVVEEILNYARRKNVSKIVVGKPEKPRWREVLFGSIVDSLVRRSGVIDVYVIHGEHDAAEPKPVGRTFANARRSPATAYAWSVAIVAACTLLCLGLELIFPRFDLANLIMVYLLGVVVAAARFGRGPSILASVLSVATFDVLFVPPRGTFAVEDTRYFITFGIMLATALIISNLTYRIRQQAAAARQREQRTQELYDMSRELASMRGVTELAQCAMRHTADVFDSKVALFLPDGAGLLQTEEVFARSSDVRLRGIRYQPDERERGVAAWTFEHGEVAGLGTKTLASSKALYLPLNVYSGTVGVLGLLPSDPAHLLGHEQLRALEAFANQTAVALERARLADQAEQARVRAETEQLRNTLLSSVSHDLRTPLATITGAASALLDDGGALGAASRRELTQSIYDESERLSLLVRNLLDMTRLESGALQLHREPHALEEIVGYVLDRMERQLTGREVRVSIPADLPQISLDGMLVSQVLINLLENTAKYTPRGTPVEITAWVEGDAIVTSIADRGPGLPAGEEARVFEKFHRVANSASGAGLGLAICRAIVEAHGGSIAAANREGGGAVFRFTLPLHG